MRQHRARITSRHDQAARLYTRLRARCRLRFIPANSRARANKAKHVKQAHAMRKSVDEECEKRKQDSNDSNAPIDSALPRIAVGTLNCRRTAPQQMIHHPRTMSANVEISKNAVTPTHACMKQNDTAATLAAQPCRARRRPRSCCEAKVSRVRSAKSSSSPTSRNHACPPTPHLTAPPAPPNAQLRADSPSQHAARRPSKPLPQQASTASSTSSSKPS